MSKRLMRAILALAVVSLTIGVAIAGAAFLWDALM